MKSLNPIVVLLVFLLGQAGIWSWQWIDYQRQNEEHVSEFDRFGEALFSTAALGAYRECRGGVYDPQELSETLEAVREEIGSVQITLSDSAGQAIVQVGSTQEDLQGVTKFAGEFGSPVPRRGHARGPGWGRAVNSQAWRTLPPGSLHLEIMHPRGALDAKLAADLRRFLVTACSLALAFTLLGIALCIYQRSTRLSARLAGANERVHALEYLSRLGAGLLHETRNPLGIVRGQAQRIAEGKVPRDEVPATARTILDETDRTLTRLDEFLLLSRPGDPKPSHFQIRPMVLDLLELLQADADDQGVTLRVTGEDFPMRADADHTRRFLLNLLLNALQAIETDGLVRVDLVRGPASNTIRILDDGHGIPAKIRETLFEPYVTSRPGGTGLGLSICMRIAQEHGWLLSAERGHPKGTIMTIEVPTV